MNDTVTVIPTEEQRTAQARAKAKDVLSRSAGFKGLKVDDQKSVYLSLVQEYIDQDKDRYGLSRSQATDSGSDMGYKGYDPAYGGETKAFTELVDSVDFPKFVADLLKAVFEANLSVMKTQTDAFIKLMKEATKSVADFIKKVKDDDAFAKVAEMNNEKYQITTEKQADGTSKLVLTTPDGGKADMEDAEVKKALFDAKLQMAQEHRAALQQILLMGVTRLVVESGTIEAGVDFSIKATRASTAHHEDQNVNVTTANFSYDEPLGGLFGGPSGSIETTNTNIQVNTSDKKATDDLSATLHGKVNIKFKTDYFNLNNFLSMYTNGAVLPSGQVGIAPQPGRAGAPAIPGQVGAQGR